MDWIPVVFVTFKFLVLGIGMFFAIKWHYDQGKKGKKTDTRAVLRATVMVAVIFVVLLVGLGFATFDAAKMLGLDMALP
jgi:heme/copper-type cytochrome/quinol oxidase subunit 2